jgi:hypothetical protein
MNVGYFIVEQEIAEEAMERYRLEKQIREVKRHTANRRAQLGGGLIEQRPRHGARFVRKVDFETAMRQIEKNGHPTTAARLRLARHVG